MLSPLDECTVVLHKFTPQDLVVIIRQRPLFVFFSSTLLLLLFSCVGNQTAFFSSGTRPWNNRQLTCTRPCSVRFGCQQQVFFPAVAVVIPNQSPRKMFLETNSQGSDQCTQGVPSSTTRTHHPQQLSSLQFFVVSSRSSPFLVPPRLAEFHQRETRCLECEIVQCFLVEYVPEIFC